MIYENIDIKYEGNKAWLLTYIHSDMAEIEPQIRPLVLVVPGGGYGYTADREAEPVALRFAAAGFNAAVLRYSVFPVKYPISLCQLALAVAYIKENAGRLRTDPDRIITCGFSAGGHLAASLGNSWNSSELSRLTGKEAELMRPAGQILCYSVITSGEKAHRGSFDNLIGREADEKLTEALSIEKHVGAHTPKSFIWHTFADKLVPVENSLMMAQALRAAGVPFELHIFPEGWHGLSLADRETAKNREAVPDFAAKNWFPLACEWVERLR